MHRLAAITKGHAMTTIVMLALEGSRIPLAINPDWQYRTMGNDPTCYQYAEGRLPPNYPVPSNLGPVILSQHCVVITANRPGNACAFYWDKPLVYA